MRELMSEFKELRLHGMAVPGRNWPPTAGPALRRHAG